MDKLATVKAWELPFYRLGIAKKAGVEANFCFITYGGLGDVLCSEPTVRYTGEVLAPKMGIKSITVISRFPELFQHLRGVECLKTNDDGLLDIEGGTERYHFLYLGHVEGNLQHAFFTHNNMIAVDYPALSALRMQLPHRYKALETTIGKFPLHNSQNLVVVHPGNHWKSKAFPKHWWDEVLRGLASFCTPVLIGGPSNADPGTVAVETDGCIDLRTKLSIPESAALLKEAKVLLTNDSFPLHLATIGQAHICFFATAKDPEWLYHYRKTDENKIEFGWRMEDMALGGAYQRTFDGFTSHTPNHLSKATFTELAKWLPKPAQVVERVQYLAKP